jgi:putative acetyltransferase
VSTRGDVVVRAETWSDHAAIRRVNEAAFPTAEEANLVEALRRSGLVLLSLVAERDGVVVGHILFSRMWIDAARGPTDVVALAPMAIAPPDQRKGIGGGLIRAGLDALRAAGERAVIVVGHAEYYPRFGFSTGLTRSIESPFSSDVFMALELVPGALSGVSGRVRYPPEFGVA